MYWENLLLNFNILLGLTFKENCNDFRNTKVIDIYKVLTKEKCIVNIYDPYVNKVEVYEKYKIKIIENLVDKQKGY